jgi:hypothetical protein
MDDVPNSVHTEGLRTNRCYRRKMSEIFWESCNLFDSYIPGFQELAKLYMGMQFLQIPSFFSLFIRYTKARESWRTESQFMKNWIWWHPLLNHVRNHFETWQICIVFRRLVVFRSPLQGKGWFFVLSFFLQLAGLFLNFVINGDMRCVLWMHICI